MAFELSGTVKEIFDEQTFGSGFTKREFVVTTQGEKYPQDIKFECLKDKVKLIEKLNRGDKVSVTFDIRGNEWKGRYFVNLVAWKIEAQGDGDQPAAFDPAEEVADQGDEPF